MICCYYIGHLVIDSYKQSFFIKNTSISSASVKMKGIRVIFVDIS